MATAASCHYWIRVNLSIEICVKEATIDVALNTHNDLSYTGLPSNPQALYQRLFALYQNKKHSLHKVFRPNQWNTLCPPSGQTNLQDCDLTQIIAVLQSENILQPLGGWKIKGLQAGDTSRGAFIYKTRQLRNELKHGNIQDISTLNQFNTYWVRIENILKGLGYQNMQRFYDLQTEPLDPHGIVILHLINNHITNINQNIHTFKKDTTTDMKALQSDTTSLRYDLTTTAQDLEEAFGDIGDVKQNCEASVKNIHVEIDAVQTDIDALDDCVHFLHESTQKDLEDVRNDICVLSTDLGALQDVQEVGSHNIAEMLSMFAFINNVFFFI